MMKILKLPLMRNNNNPLEGRKFHNHLGQELNVYKLLHELFAEVLLCMSWICQGAEGAIGVSEQHLGLRGYLCFHKVDRHPETDKQYNRI